MYRLYSYFRSSASWRVRIAAHFKGLDVQVVPVNLLEGQQRGAEHRARNPLMTVPVLEVTPSGGGAPFLLPQSMAILHYLEERHPTPALLPLDLQRRAQVRCLAELINADTHPLQNLGTLKHLETTFGATPEQRTAWAQHFIARGFAAVEGMLLQTGGRYCVGDDLTLADVCLVPQMYNARRYKVDLAPFPTLVRVADEAARLPAFVQTDPAHQVDTPSAA